MLHLIRVPTTWILLCCFAFVAGCQNSKLPPKEKWKKFSSSDGRVSVLFPGSPKEQTQTVDSAAGALVVKMIGYESGQRAFMINHLTYPVDPSQYDVDAGLSGACQGATQNVNGTILETTDVELSGFPGKSILVRTPRNFVRARIYIDPKGPTLFQAMCIGTRDFADGSESKTFFDSLTIK